MSVVCLCAGPVMSWLPVQGVTLMDLISNQNEDKGIQITFFLAKLKPVAIAKKDNIFSKQ